MPLRYLFCLSAQQPCPLRAIKEGCFNQDTQLIVEGQEERCSHTSDAQYVTTNPLQVKVHCFVDVSTEVSYMRAYSRTHLKLECLLHADTHIKYMYDDQNLCVSYNILFM